jgi:cystathionine beta-lyase
MKNKSGKRPETLLTHSGRHPHDHFGIVNTPVFRASTILQPNMAEYKRTKGPREPRYGRRGTPTTFTLEDMISDVEGAAGCMLCASGLNAVSLAVMSQVKSGDHVLMADCVYGPARNLANNVLPRMNVTTTFFDPAIGAGIGEMIQSNTTVVYLETPGSQTFDMQDIPAIAAFAKAKGVVVMTDNTWGTPLFFKPFEHGCDISIHAATKYIVGHSDAMLGAVSYTAEMEESIRNMAGWLGIFAGPDDVYLGTRGMRTMAVRLKQHQESALLMADFLLSRPEVDRVLYPPHPTSAGHEIWKRDFTGGSGLMGVVLKPVSEPAVAAMLDGLELYGMGASWGGFESLILPADPSGNRTATKWDEKGQLLRIHVGLENIDDLTEDLGAGLDRLQMAQ